MGGPAAHQLRRSVGGLTAETAASRLPRWEFLDSVKAWFQNEAAEARDLGQDTKGRLERDLDRREADLALSPEERLEQMQSKIEDNSGFEAIQDRIENKGAMADAAADVAGIDNKARDAANDIMDLDSEEITPQTPHPPPSELVGEAATALVLATLLHQLNNLL